MLLLQLLEYQIRLQPRIQLQQRLDFEPDVRERILPGQPVPRLDRLARQPTALTPRQAVRSLMPTFAAAVASGLLRPSSFINASLVGP